MLGFRIGMAAIASAGFLTSVALAEVEGKLPDGVTVLTEEELHEYLVGSTVTGVFRETVWVEYYEPKGRIRGTWGGRPYGGTWSISGPWMCYDFGGTANDRCRTISLDGDQITYFKESGEASTSGNKLIPGDEAAPPPFKFGPINTNFWGDVAIKGYDPVAYFVDGAARKGSEEFSYKWLGATWHFASAEHRDLFMANPTQYAPQYGGYCSSGVAGGSSDSTDPEAWRIVDGKLYLLYSKKTLANWEQDAGANIQKANANWPQVLTSLEQ